MHQHACYTPNTVLRAIADAGRVLNRSPHSELTLRPEQKQQLLRGTAGAILENIVAQSQGEWFPHTGPNFKPTQERVATCSSAEDGFLTALKRLGQLAKKACMPADAPMKIIVDGTNNPVLFWKNTDYSNIPSSALALMPIRIGKTIWPAGTITKVKAPDGVRTRSNQPVEILQAGEITALGAIRLSFFALPAWERRHFVAERPGEPKASISMQDFAEQVGAATNALLLIRAW
jgi:hypothetical protein